MSSWTEFEAEVPEFAGRVRAIFDAGTNKTLATIRHDGSPRISGTELVIDSSGVWLGIMPESRKLRDIRRDSRVALHSPTLEPPTDAPWPGDAKLSGRLIARTPPHDKDAAGGEMFDLDINEVVLTHLNESATRLVIESWHPDRGFEIRDRA